MNQYYRHFKGNVYRVLHIAKHSETLEEMVVYHAMYGERGIWVRPLAMFEEVRIPAQCRPGSPVILGHLC